MVRQGLNPVDIYRPIMLSKVIQTKWFCSFNEQKYTTCTINKKSSEELYACVSSMPSPSMELFLHSVMAMVFRVWYKHERSPLLSWHESLTFLASFSFFKLDKETSLVKGLSYKWDYMGERGGSEVSSFGLTQTLSLNPPPPRGLIHRSLLGS